MATFWANSESGDVLPLLLKLQREGHTVSMGGEVTRAGRGLVPFVSNPPSGAIVLFDHCNDGALGSDLRRKGFRVIGGNPFEHDLEVDRPSGARIMRAAGIHTPLTLPFQRIADAVRFLEKASGNWFVKISGSQATCASTFDSSPDEMIRYLKWVEQKGQVKPFELQQRVYGVEVSCNGWFDGERFVPPFDLTIEEKKFLTGDHGPRTGCESCVVWMGDGALAARTVELIEDDLARARYCGPVDCNSIVDTDGQPFGLEWTARFGFDALQAWMRLFSEEDDLGGQLEAFVEGDLDEWEHQPVMSATLKVTVPPYPIENEKELKGMEEFPLPEGVLADTFDPVDVMKRGKDVMLAGESANIGTTSAQGLSLQELRNELLRQARQLNISTAQYRVDPLNRSNRDMAELQRLNLMGIEWKS